VQQVVHGRAERDGGAAEPHRDNGPLGLADPDHRPLHPDNERRDPDGREGESPPIQPSGVRHAEVGDESPRQQQSDQPGEG
jgi:hypothetical protein